MFILDDLLLSPVKGLLWIFDKIHEAAREEMANEEQNLLQELSELYMLLETGRISEETFDRRELELLDRLDKIRGEDKDVDENQEGATDQPEQKA